MKYFHGGYGKLRVGELVLPPAKTRTATTASYTIARGICDPNFVYVTTDPDTALVFACAHPSGRGKVYEVEPVGNLAHDPDCKVDGLSFQCRAARVTRVIRVSGKTIKNVVKMLKEPA